MHDEKTPFRVVVNAHGQPALWPLGRRPPRGWLAAAMVGSRARCCDYLDRLTPEGAHQLAAALWPQVRRASGPAGGALVDLIDRIGRQAAHAPAVRDSRTSLDFGEFNRHCTAVAAELTAAGVLAGDRVAVLLPYSVEFVVAVLAILRVGAVCVPVEPDLPAERRADLLTAAAVSVVLAGGRPERVVAAGVSRSATRDALALHPEPPGPGVVWSYDQLHGLAAAPASLPVAGAASVVVRPRTHGPLFPVELAWSLGTGAEAVLVADGEPAPPSAAYLTAAPARHPAELRTHWWRGPAEPTVLWGVPESAVVAVGATAAGPGRPLPGVRFLVLDRDLVPVPPDAVGRLYVAGWAAGGGYARRPGLTAMRLLPDPSGPPGSRMLDTGIAVRRVSPDDVGYAN